MSKWSKAPFLALYAAEEMGQGRSYRNPFSGEVMPSVTTVLKQQDLSHLMQWSADRVAEKAVARTDIVLGDPDLAFSRLRFAHNEFRDERAEKGTAVHQTIQADFEDSWDYPELDDEAEGMMAQWGSFVDSYGVEILHNEFTVFGEGYAGTADLIIKYADPFSGESRTALVDIKTSAGIHDSHRYQLAALKTAPMWAERVMSPEGADATLKKRGDLPESYWRKRDNPALAVDGVFVLQLREGFYRFEEVEHIPHYYDVFRAYLGVHEAKAKLKGAAK